jgi:hypothetical protein
VIVQGNGSDLGNRKSLKGRAKRKLITQSMVLSLIDIANKSGVEDKKRSFWNTYHCQNRIYTADGRMYGTYCKNRFCTLCCSIRKADIINRYLPIVQTWQEPYFLTLTVKSVPYNRLKPVMRSMVTEFRKIIDKYKKVHKRGKGTKLIGIRSLESNFNPVTKTYNPHFHILVASAEMGNILLNEWVNRGKSGRVNRAAQNIMKVTNNLTILIELIKYGSKIFTEPDINKKTRVKGREKLYTAALNNIFDAMKGFRIFERFGFNLPPNTKEVTGASLFHNCSEWNYDMKAFGWLNNQGEKLADFVPVPQLIELLHNGIDNIVC